MTNTNNEPITSDFDLDMSKRVMVSDTIPSATPENYTGCVDTEADSEWEAARLAFEEYYKDAPWNLSESGDEHASAEEHRRMSDTEGVE